MRDSNIAIIVAAGKGKRMGKPKQFIELAGKPMLWWTLAAFERSKAVDGIILVVNREELNKAKKFRFSKLIEIVAGGKERADSVRNGLKELPAAAKIVLIHDGARPFVTPEIIERSVAAAKKYGAIVVGVPVKDTVKQLQTSNFKIQKTVDRRRLWQAQTPQVFKKDIILKAYSKGAGQRVTDDAMLVEKLGKPVKLVMGSPLNLKITSPEDLLLAEGILKR